MAEPFREWNADSLRRDRIVGKSYFQAPLTDLHAHGLDIALVGDDIPSKLALGIGYVLARKAPASGAEAGAGGAEQAAAEAAASKPVPVRSGLNYYSYREFGEALVVLQAYLFYSHPIILAAIRPGIEPSNRHDRPLGWSQPQPHCDAPFAFGVQTSTWPSPATRAISIPTQAQRPVIRCAMLSVTVCLGTAAISRSGPAWSSSSLPTAS